VNKKYRFLTKEISGIFTIPSGIITTEITTLERIIQEIPEIGILTTKSIGLEPKEGNKEPLLAQYRHSFSFINAVGLRNPGVDEFSKKLTAIKIPKDRFLLISIFGRNEEEFKKVAKKLVKYTDGFELNISCPHSDKYGQIIGKNSLLVEKIVRSVASLGKPTLVKISPNLKIKEIVKRAIKGGVVGITAINTKGPELYLHDGYPLLSNKVGGISGKAILKLGLKSVREIRKITDLPIIGCGGISSAEDIKKYQAAGADYFGVGSALAGMKTEEIKNYFKNLMRDFEKGTKTAKKFLKTELKMGYRKYKVKKKTRLASDLFLLELNHKIKVKPGQFVFAWLPEKGEKPFSVFDDEPLSLLFQKKGCFTNELSKLKKGEFLYIRGPYGNSPKIKGKTLLIGGGTGIAALYLFAKRNKKATLLLGAKDKKHLVSEKFKNVCKKLYLFTENGEIGNKGLVTDRLEEIIQETQSKNCLNCGPEAMVRKALQKESQYLSLKNIFSSIEYLTKCGVGLCGSCATNKGYRNCVDGTFFKPDQI